jgi:hypothetical protein
MELYSKNASSRAADFSPQWVGEPLALFGCVAWNVICRSDFRQNVVRVAQDLATIVEIERWQMH